MKRISILVLALTLTACGSGGTHSGGAVQEPSNEPIFILTCADKDPSKCVDVINRY